MVGMFLMFVIVRFMNIVVIVLVCFLCGMRFVVIIELSLKNVLWLRFVMRWVSSSVV